MKNLFKYQFPLAAWAIVIYFLSDIPDIYFLVQLPPGVEKLIHALLFFILAWLIWRVLYFQANFALMRKGANLGALLFCFVFAALDEYHHTFVSGRRADFYNLVADTGGALLFVAVVFLKRRLNR